MLSANPWFCFIDVTTKILAKQYDPATLDRLEEEMNHVLALIERFPCISTGIGFIQNFTMMFIVSIMQAGDQYGTSKDHWSKSCMIRSTGAATHYSCANCSSWWLNAISHDHLQGDTSSEANNTWRCPCVCMCRPWPGWIKKKSILSTSGSHTLRRQPTDSAYQIIMFFSHLTASRHTPWQHDGVWYNTLS